MACMTRFRLLLLLCLMILLFPSLSLQAQGSTDFSIEYDETQSSFFDEAASQRWIFSGEALDRLEIRAVRIAGQFTPHLRLLDNTGQLLAESDGGTFPDTDILRYTDGLPADGPYQIEVTGINFASNGIDNPAEYSLSLEYLGKRRTDPDEGFAPLPTVGREPPPELAGGEPFATALQLNVYGAEPELLRSDTADVPVRYLLRGAGREIAINNAVPIVRGVASVTFLDNGTGLLLRNENLSGTRTFFSDAGFMVGYVDGRREYVFTLENGSIIRTDFFGIESIEVQNGVIGVRLLNSEGDRTVRRFVTDGSLLDMRRLAGGSDATGEALAQITLDGERFITTDYQGFRTLAYYQGEVRVTYGADARLLSDTAQLSLRQDGDQSQITLFYAPAGSGVSRRVSMAVDWDGLGDIRIQQQTVTVEPLAGGSLREPLDALNALLIEDGAAQFSRRDGTTRTALPDGTEIESPAALAEADSLLPYEDGFRSRNFNNLGQMIAPDCLCRNLALAALPVNPANGNFFYAVQDVSIPSHTLALDWQRYYNSQDAAATPDYLLASPAGYARLGQGWRHSYQYELDVRGVPLGRLRLVLPDGSQHYFTLAADSTLWRSRTLQDWQLERVGGIIGRWIATRGADGVRFYFDRAGRLERISETPERSITLSPLPLTYGENGFILTEPYGRRLEIYQDAQGIITSVRDTAAREIRYGYDGAELSGVEYNSSVNTARYSYTASGLLTRIDDVRSPYARTASIAYEGRRVRQFTENPEGDLVRRYTFDYEEGFTVRSLRVGEETSSETWFYNERNQLVRYSTPRPGYDIEFTYDENTGSLTSYRTPLRTSFTYEYDSRGNLLQYEDPFLAGDAATSFEWEFRGARSLLRGVAYPSNGLETFVWSEGEHPQLLQHNRLVSVGQERVFRSTRYEYDDWGRVILIVQPGEIATRYFYDEFGYLSVIYEGVQLAADETAADITESNRALRTLQIDYDLIGQLRAVTDGRGQTYTLNWEPSSGNLRDINGPGGVFLRYTYDERGRVTLVDDRGQDTILQYNGLDQVISIIDSNNAVQTYEYDAAGNLRSVVDDLQNETRYAYDELGNLAQVVSPSGLVTNYETVLEGDFLVRREVDPAGRAITRRYDALGRLRFYSIAQDDFLQEFRLEYNRGGWLTSITEIQAGRTLALEYDLIGQVLAVDVTGSRTTFRYDPAGNLASVTSPAGRTWRYAVDALGNIAEVTLPDGDTLAYTYDENSNLLTATDSGGLVTTYVYDALNQLISVEDPAGNITGYDYDLRGNLSSIIDPRGETQLFAYNELDLLLQATDGSGQTTTYEYDTVGRLVNVARPGVRSTRLTYDDANNIIAVTERPREQRTLYNYDALGRITSITDPLGHTTTYTYNALGNITRIIDALGNEERYLWAADGHTLTGMIAADGHQYAVNVDGMGRVTTIRDVTTEQNVALNTEVFYDPDGYVTGLQTGTDQARVSGAGDLFYRVTLDANGVPVRYVDALDGEWLLERDDSGRLIALTNPLGDVTRYERDPAGRVVQVLYHAGTEAEISETYTYDANGNITAYEGVDGVRNTYFYDRNNRLLQATLAVGTPVESRYTFEYNALGQLIRVQDPLGRDTRTFYSLDSITRIERTLGEIVLAMSYFYDDAGNLREITLPESADQEAPIRINLTYDALDRRVRYVDGENSAWTYSYDPVDNLVQISDPLGSVVQYEYDDAGRVTRIVYPLGSSVGLRYDSSGNLAEVILPTNQNGERQVVSYRLDVAGNVLEMEMGDGTARYTYNTLGQPTQRIFPDGQRTTYEYDSAANLAAMTYSQGDSLQYEYDAAGRLLRAGNIRYEYDALGRLTRLENGELSVSYVYDLVGNLLVRDAGEFGQTLYTYDELDRPTRIDFGGETVEIVYDERSFVRQIIRSNGVRTAINYDAVGRITSILHLGADNTRLEGFNYQYDAVGNLIRADRITDGWRVLYSYDVAHRLIDERWLNEIGEAVYTASFRYDAAGNRIEEIRDGQRTLYLYNDQNQLIGEVRNLARQTGALPLLPLGLVFFGGLAFSKRRRHALWLVPLLLPMILVGGVQAQTSALPDVRYEYDQNGSLSRVRYITSRQGSIEQSNDLLLTYDQENRLTAIQGMSESGEAVDVRLEYDVFSRLVGWQSGEETRQFFYDQERLLGSRGNGGIQPMLSLGDWQLLQVQGDDILWPLLDQLGSPRRFAGVDGSLSSDPRHALEFGSFGTRIYPTSGGLPPDDSALTQPQQTFNGMIIEPESGFYLAGLRAYDAQVGRFLQVDPLRQDPIGTLYTYARNRPFVFRDASGLMAQPYVQPVRAAALNDDLRPEDLLPSPDVPNFVSPQTTQRLQSDETVRALQLLYAARYQMNAVVGRMDPLLGDFYVLDLNPMPFAARQREGQSLQMVLNLYESGNDWLPNPLPDPTDSINPFELLNDVQDHVTWVTMDPLVWGIDPLLPRTLPDVPLPSAITPQLAAESALVDQLQPLPIATALLAETETLLDFPQQVDAVPQVALPYAQPPVVRLELPVLISLDRLREETYDLLQPILLPQDCADCIPPLGFSD